MKDLGREGRENLFQALALMRDNEEFQKKYGGIPDVISDARGTSVSILCHMITRMKSEIDSNKDTKSKCIQLLDGLSEMWTAMVDDREKMCEKIFSLETEIELLRKAINLQAQVDQRGMQSLNREEGRRDESRYQPQQPNETLQVGGHSSSLNQSEIASLSPSNSSTRNTSIEEDNNETSFNDSRFDIRSQFQQQDQLQSQFTSQTSQQVDFTHPLLTRNPYDSLDTSYYNPSQFFQRQSSLFKRTKRGGRGGATGTRKKSTTPKSTASTQSKPKQKRKPRNGKQSAIEIVVDLTNEMASNSANDSSVVGVTQEQDESPDKHCFEYTSCFLDNETETFDESLPSLPLV